MTTSAMEIYELKRVKLTSKPSIGDTISDYESTLIPHESVLELGGRYIITYNTIKVLEIHTATGGKTFNATGNITISGANKITVGQEGVTFAFDYETYNVGDDSIHLPLRTISMLSQDFDILSGYVFLAARKKNVLRPHWYDILPNDKDISEKAEIIAIHEGYIYPIGFAGNTRAYINYTLDAWASGGILATPPDDNCLSSLFTITAGNVSVEFPSYFPLLSMNLQ